MVELASRAFRTNALCLALANAAAAAGLALGQPGSSSALQFLQLLAPLWMWALGFAGAGVLLAARQHLAGHTVAVIVWSMTAIGAVLGLVEGTTRSPAGTVLFAGLLVAVAALHVNGMWFRRRQWRLIKGAQERQ